MCLSPSWALHIQFGGVSYVYQLYFHVANLLDDSDFNYTNLGKIIFIYYFFGSSLVLIINLSIMS